MFAWSSWPSWCKANFSQQRVWPSIRSSPVHLFHCHEGSWCRRTSTPGKLKSQDCRGAVWFAGATSGYQMLKKGYCGNDVLICPLTFVDVTAKAMLNKETCFYVSFPQYANKKHANVFKSKTSNFGSQDETTPQATLCQELPESFFTFL